MPIFLVGLKDHIEGTELHFHMHVIEKGESKIKNLDLDYKIARKGDNAVAEINVPHEVYLGQFDCHYQRKANSASRWEQVEGI
jgi:hypothetical protein